MTFNIIVVIVIIIFSLYQADRYKKEYKKELLGIHCLGMVHDSPG